MILETVITRFRVFDDAPVEFALLQLNINQNHTVFVVTQDGKLFRPLSDGDFRCWIPKSTGNTLASHCQHYANKVELNTPTTMRGKMSHGKE